MNKEIKYNLILWGVIIATILLFSSIFTAHGMETERKAVCYFIDEDDEEDIFGGRTRLRLFQQATWTSDMIPQLDSTLDIGTTEERVAEIWADRVTTTDAIDSALFCISGDCIASWAGIAVGNVNDWLSSGDETYLYPSSTNRGIYASASSSINANFRIDGSASTTGSSYIAGTASTSEAFVSGDVHIGGNITTDGNASTTGSLYIKNDLTVAGTASSTWYGNGGNLTILDDVSETIDSFWKHTANKGVHERVGFTSNSGLNFTHDAGEIYDSNGYLIYDINASSSINAATNTVNYLVWTSGNDLELASTLPTDPNLKDITLGIVNAAGGTIWELNSIPPLASSTNQLFVAFQEIVGDAVVSGLIVSEHTGDATWDVDMTSGVYYNTGYGREAVNAFDSNTTDLTLWYQDGSGNWQYISDDEIDTTGYNTGTATSSVTANLYYRSTWFVTDENLHWVYPSTSYATVAQCIAGSDTTLPTGLADHPKSTSICLRGNASAFPTAGSDPWIDVRPKFNSVAGAGNITDHGELAGLSDDDHIQYGALAQDETVTGLWAFGQTRTTLQNATSTYSDHATTTGSTYLTNLTTPAGAFLAISDTGQVIATTSPSGITNLNDETLGSMGDVSTTTIAYGSMLIWDLSNWVSSSTMPYFETEFAKLYNATTTLSGFTPHNAVTITGEDYASLSTQEITFSNIDAANTDLTDAYAWTGIHSNSADLRVTGALHATTTDFDMLVVNGNASSTGAMSIGADAAIGGVLQFTTAGDNFTYFDNALTNYFQWDDSADMFHFSNDVDVTGVASTSAGFRTNDDFIVGSEGNATSSRMDITDGTNGVRIIPGATTTLEFY